MKLYNPVVPVIMRVNIKKQPLKTEHVAIDDAGQVEVLNWIKVLIEKEDLSIFATGKITTVEVRIAVGGENGKTMSFAFKGLDPLQVKQLILDNLK